MEILLSTVSSALYLTGCASQSQEEKPKEPSGNECNSDSFIAQPILPFEIAPADPTVYIEDKSIGLLIKELGNDLSSELNNDPSNQEEVIEKYSSVIAYKIASAYCEEGIDAAVDIFERLESSILNAYFIQVNVFEALVKEYSQIAPCVVVKSAKNRRDPSYYISQLIWNSDLDFKHIASFLENIFRINKELGVYATYDLLSEALFLKEDRKAKIEMFIIFSLIGDPFLSYFAEQEEFRWKYGNYLCDGIGREKFSKLLMDISEENAYELIDRLFEKKRFDELTNSLVDILQVERDKGLSLIKKFFNHHELISPGASFFLDEKVIDKLGLSFDETAEIISHIYNCINDYYDYSYYPNESTDKDKHQTLTAIFKMKNKGAEVLKSLLRKFPKEATALLSYETIEKEAGLRVEVAHIMEDIFNCSDSGQDKEATDVLASFLLDIYSTNKEKALALIALWEKKFAPEIFDKIMTEVIKRNGSVIKEFVIKGYYEKGSDTILSLIKDFIDIEDIPQLLIDMCREREDGFCSGSIAYRANEIINVYDDKAKDYIYKTLLTIYPLEAGDIITYGNRKFEEGYIIEIGNKINEDFGWEKAVAFIISEIYRIDMETGRNAVTRSLLEQYFSSPSVMWNFFKDLLAQAQKIPADQRTAITYSPGVDLFAANKYYEIIRIPLESGDREEEQKAAQVLSGQILSSYGYMEKGLAMLEDTKTIAWAILECYKLNSDGNLFDIVMSELAESKDMEKAWKILYYLASQDVATSAMLVGNSFYRFDRAYDGEKFFDFFTTIFDFSLSNGEAEEKDIAQKLLKQLQSEECGLPNGSGYCCSDFSGNLLDRYTR